MLRLSPFTDLIKSYDVLNQTVSFQTISAKWQNLFGANDFLPAIFQSIRQENGVYSLSRRDIFKERDVQRKIVKILIWGYPNGFRGNNLNRVVAGIGRMVEILDAVNPNCTRGSFEQLYHQLSAIPGLGPSTVSKLLYFFNISIGDVKAIIVDRFVRASFAHINELEGLNLDGTSFDSYYNQVVHINRFARRLGIEGADKLEYYLFTVGKSYN